MSEQLPAVVNEDDKFIPAEHIGTIDPNYYCRGWNPKRGKYCATRAGARTSHPGFGRCWVHGGNSNEHRHLRYSKIKRAALRNAIERFEADPDPLNIQPELAFVRALLEDFVNRYQQWREALLAWHDSYQSARKPIQTARIAQLQRVLDEYEAMNGNLSDEQRKDLDAAREFASSLAGPLVSTKPRYIMDIADAYRLLAEVKSMVATIENVEAQNAISRKDMFRVLGEMGRVVDLLIDDDALKQKIKDQWLSIRLS